MTCPRTPDAAPHAGADAGTGGPGPGATPTPRMPSDSEVTRLHTEEFAADPYAVYERLRRYGSLAPVEVAPGVDALLVIDYRAALDLLHDPVTWSKDTREWQQTVPADSPLLPLLGWRPNPLHQDGDLHHRYRSAISDSFDRFPPHELRDHVSHSADTLIADFGTAGHAELMGQYARKLPLLLFNRLFGMPDSYGDHLVSAFGRMLEANDPREAAAGNAAYERYVQKLVAAKKERRDADLTSWLLDHPAGLSEEEVLHQVVLTMGIGHESTTNLVGNALARMLTDDRYYGTLSGGALTPRDAIHDVLRNEPPMANFSAHFPKRDVLFHGTRVRRGQLVLVSYAAANAQMGRSAPGEGGGALGPGGGGAHLAWAAGPHACPVQGAALLVATTAIERLTAALSDIRLAVDYDELEWRSGPFHRALAELPARFTPIRPDEAGAMPWDGGGSRPRP